MFIQRIYITRFAGLKDFHLHFDEHFQFVYGVNESGKSTILAFIRAMFYGLGRQNRNPEKNARLRYTPWQSTEEMAGRIDFTWQQNNFSLTRSFGANKAGDRTSVRDEILGKELRLQNADAPGEEILKLTEQEFLSTILIRNPRSTTSNRSVEERITYLQDSGSETYSAAEITESLKKEQYALTGGKTGGILGSLQTKRRELEADLAAAIQRDQAQLACLSRLDIMRERLQAVEHSIAVCAYQEELNELQRQINSWEQYKQRQTYIQENVSENTAFSEYGFKPVPVKELHGLTEQSKGLDLFAQEAAEARLQMENACEHERALSLSLHQARQEKARCEEAKKHHAAQEKPWLTRSQQHIKAPSPFAVGLIVLLLSILSLLGLFFLKRELFPAMLLLLVIPLAVFFILQRQRQAQVRKARLAAEQRHRFWQQANSIESARQKALWKVEQIESDLHHNLQDVKRKQEKYALKHENYARARESLLKSLRAWIRNIPPDADPQAVLEALRDFSVENEERKRWLTLNTPQYSQEEQQALAAAHADNVQRVRELRNILASGFKLRSREDNLSIEELRSEQISLEARIAVDKAELTNLQQNRGVTAEIEAKLQALLVQEASVQEDVAANLLAQELLSIAAERYHTNVRPELHARANKWLVTLSEGRYQNLQLDEDGGLAVSSGETDPYYHDSFYSNGTRDLIWLSLRLALADILSRKKQFSLPLYLDDSIAFLDKQRTQTFIHALATHAQENARQIILFSANAEARDMVKAAAWPLLELKPLKP